MTRKNPPKKLIVISAIAVVAAGLVTVLVISLNITPLLFKKALKEALPKEKTELFKYFPFSEENALKEWEEKIFRGKVVYRIEKDGTCSFVRATTDKAASALYYKMRMDAKKRQPVISWKWDVKKFPVKKMPENLEKQDEDDFAARVYVIFLAPFFTNSKVIEYVWAEKLPKGTEGISPYSGNIRLMVLRSGLDKEGGLKSEERDIVADYKKIFGRTPEYDIGAVAFMTNAEHTESGADAVYDDIRLEYKGGST